MLFTIPEEKNGIKGIPDAPSTLKCDNYTPCLTSSLPGLQANE